MPARRKTTRARKAGSPKKPRAKSAPAWARLSDRELLGLRLRDLKLTLRGNPLQRAIQRLYTELERKGLNFRPHCWLAEEWFSPDGIPGVAIPFYLSHPRLKRLERKMTREVEGGTPESLMCLLRHEAGHALDSAYRLRRRAEWRRVFGPASRPYDDSYRPKPGSRRFVQHLDAWYAQSHPTEDFAETFAVWLKPGNQWRRTYRDWPALAKLEYVDRLMQELRAHKQLVRSRVAVEALRTDDRTLAEYYRTKLDRYAPMRAHVTDHLIRRVFAAYPPKANSEHAAKLLRSLRRSELRELAATLGVSQYLVRQVVRLLVQRCEVLDLYVRRAGKEGRLGALGLIKRVARLNLRGRGERHSR